MVEKVDMKGAGGGQELSASDVETGGPRSSQNGGERCLEVEVEGREADRLFGREVCGASPGGRSCHVLACEKGRSGPTQREGAGNRKRRHGRVVHVQTRRFFWCNGVVALGNTNWCCNMYHVTVGDVSR